MATRLSKFRAVTVLRMRLIERHTLQQCADHLEIGVPAVHAWERKLLEAYGGLDRQALRDVEYRMREDWHPAWSWPQFTGERG